jgi:hypothetical protein
MAEFWHDCVTCLFFGIFCVLGAAIVCRVVGLSHSAGRRKSEGNNERVRKVRQLLAFPLGRLARLQGQGFCDPAFCQFQHPKAHSDVELR